MREFSKSRVLLYLNLSITVFMLIISIICFTLINTTTLFIGIDLYLIFGIALILFSTPFIINIIKYLLLPNVLITVNKHDIIIHTRKRQIRILNSKILGVSKFKSFGFVYGLNAGSIKILVATDEMPKYINFINELDKLYEMINVIILKQYKEIIQKKSTEM